MAWPLASHFSAMLQNPRIAFRDPELKQCVIEKNSQNQPRPWSGAFAVVFKGTLADGSRSMAVRCFTTESPERRERYDLISAYLRSRQLDCLVDFEYRDEAIRSAGDGKWYPLVLMDWVDGDTLFQWVRARAREGSTDALAAAADRWLALVKELADAQIAHGDLQHANVMVTRSGELKLVDYDGMCVPALVGRRNLEVGVEPYQHRERNETTHLSLDLDNFSALVIYVALKALAADPRLWQKYVETPGYDKLLFRVEDFRAPLDSPLYHELLESPAQDVRDLGEQLVTLWQGRMDQVPPLTYLTNTYAKVERLLQNQQWEEAVQLLNRRGQFRDAPKHLKPLIHQAYEHVCRKQAWRAFQRLPAEPSELNDRKVVNTWNEALFAGFPPAEAQRPRLQAARKNVQILDRLHHLVQQSSGPPQLARERAIVNMAQHLPPGYQYSLQPRVTQAYAMLDALQRLEAALDQDDDGPIAAAWREVVQARCETLVDPRHRPRIHQAEHRLPRIARLRGLREELPVDRLDQQLLALWHEELLAGHPEAERWREAYQTAVYRRDLLARLDEAVRNRDEPAILEVIQDPCLADYPLPAAWEPVIHAACDRMSRLDALLATLETGDRQRLLDVFDARLIRQFPEHFQPFQGLLQQWTEEEVLPAEAMGLRPAIARASIILADKAEQAYRVRWTWPQQRFTDECVLAICPEPPEVGDDPRAVAACFREPVDRARWERGGGSRLVRADRRWGGHSVVVWAVVDLGFVQLFSHPLILGTLDQAPHRAKGLRRIWPRLRSRRSKPEPRPLAPASDESAPTPHQKSPEADQDPIDCG